MILLSASCSAVIKIFRAGIFLAAVAFLLNAIQTASAYTVRDANTFAGAYNSAFLYVNGTNGYFRDNQTTLNPAYFWGQAEMIETVIDAYEWSSNSAYLSTITNLLNGFIKNNGSNWTWDDYNDDILWAVLAFTRGGVVTGKTNYCNIAKANFDACYARAYDTRLGGGLYWQQSTKASKNACVNGPGALAAYLLYQVYGDTGYYNKATNLYFWERSTLFNPNTGAIADNIGTNGTVNGGATTYNQGTFLGAAHFLGQTNDATLAARFTMMQMTSAGILPQYGIANNNSGFNAIFLRWMKRFSRDRNLESVYQPWYRIMANAAWNVRRSDDQLSWCQWLQPSPSGMNFYAWDCISSYSAIFAANATQGSAALAVPGNDAGHWPLDESAGTVAANLTGSNNGTVANAAWNSAGGRIGGCLVFNGGSSVVQITNPVCNDFSIALWVKTTQTGGTPQWYNGRGLVDGDVPGLANDFGTALVGGKFAFGVGNPDITIQSTTSINDGAWHQCVATREETTGVIRVYVDGVLQATGSGTKNTLNSSARLLFGAISSGGNYFNGSLDDVRIFSRALSSDEVAALYQCNVFPPSAAPTDLAATAGNGQVQLAWSEGAGATSYNVKRATVSGGTYTTIANVTTSSFTDTTATNNHSFYYVVSGVNAVGESANSTEVGASPISRVVWLRADTLNLTDGDPVALWPDSSGNGFDAIQTLPVNRPTYVASVMNGRPAVRFNSANNDFLWLYRPVQDDFTIIVVFQSTQGIGTGTAFYQGAGLVSGEVSGVVNDYGLSLNANGRALAGVGNPDTSIASGTGLNNGSPQIVTFKRTKSTGLIQLYVNGSPVAVAGGGTQSLTDTSFLVIGGQGGINNFLNGDIAEIQIYNSALSDTDRKGQEYAARCRYNLAGGAAPNAPLNLTGSAGNRKTFLTWTLTPGADSYNVWRSTNNGSTYEMIATGLNAGSYVDTTAASGRTNYYRVTASGGCGTSLNSSTIGILLPRPALGMNAGGNALNLTWPSWADDWTLYTTTNLTPPVNWQPVTNLIQSNGSNFNVTLPISNTGSRFYQLISP